MANKVSFTTPWQATAVPQNHIDNRASDFIPE
jgi:hypothetical protein